LQPAASGAEAGVLFGPSDQPDRLEEADEHVFELEARGTTPGEAYEVVPAPRHADATRQVARPSAAKQSYEAVPPSFLPRPKPRPTGTGGGGGGDDHADLSQLTSYDGEDYNEDEDDAAYQAMVHTTTTTAAHADGGAQHEAPSYVNIDAARQRASYENVDGILPPRGKQHASYENVELAGTQPGAGDNQGGVIVPEPYESVQLSQPARPLPAPRHNSSSDEAAARRPTPRPRNT